MKKRDVERTTEFSEMIQKELGIYDLQGFVSVLDEKAKGKKSFTKSDFIYKYGFEAIDLEGDSVIDIDKVFSVDDLTVKTAFCNRLGASLALLLHVKDDKECIYVRQYDIQNGNLIFDEEKYAEDKFIEWWKSFSPKAQKKGYRTKMQEILESSYFDQLLQNNGLSWTGNIDGFLVDKNNHEIKIRAIVENRYSENEAVSCYKPEKFIEQDFRTWNSLLDVAEALNIPLLLFTYSRNPKYSKEVGISIAQKVNPEKIWFKNDLHPCNNVKTSVQEIKQWLDENL